MKKIFSKTKKIFSGLLVILLTLVNTQGAFATNYLFNEPYYVFNTTPPPPSPITVTLDSAVPNPISWPSQNMTTLVWNITGSPTSCEGTGGFSTWPSPKDPTDGVHQELSTGLTPGIYIYEITCIKGASTASDTALVVVNDDSGNTPTVTLTATQNPINSGDSSDLSWTSTNATSCQTNIGPWLIPGAKPVNSGSSPETTGPLTANTTYSIICSNSGASVEAFVTVYINSPMLPTISFYADRPVINSGESTDLIWSVQNATSCTGSSGPASWTGGGNKSIPTGTESTGPLTTVTTYGLSCSNNYGSNTAFATVFINVDDDQAPTIAYFEPFSCVGGGSRYGAFPRFTWSSTNANSCTITRVTAPTLSESVGVSAQASGGSQELNGLYYFLSSLSVIGSSSNYSLQCTNTVGSDTEYAAVNTCSPDFSLTASPILRSFVNGINPGTGNPGKIATYNISATSISGFSNDIDLSIQSEPGMPSSTTFTFSSTTLVANPNPPGGYSTATLTIGIDDADFPPAGSTVYTPIVVQGIGGGLTRTVDITADATGKKIMKYLEPNN